jgi:hypothetical protein
MARSAGGGVVEVYNIDNQPVIGAVANANGDGVLGVNKKGGGFGVGGTTKRCGNRRKAA